MIVDGQERVDGMEVTGWQIRLSGTLDLDVGEAEKLGLDKIVVFIGAARLGQAQFDVMDEGVRRKNVLKASDVRLITGEMRDEAIMFLAHGSDQGGLRLVANMQERADDGPAVDVDRLAAFLMGNYGHAFDRSEGAIDMAIRLLSTPAGVEPGTGEFASNGRSGDAGGPGELHDTSPETAVETPGPEGAPLEASGPAEVEVLGHIDDRPAAAPAGGGGGSGPKVAKFHPDAGPGSPAEDIAEREVVGTVYPPGHKGKDKVLARFMEE